MQIHRDLCLLGSIHTYKINVLKECVNKENTSMEIVKAFQNNELNIHVTIQGTHEEPLFRASDIGAILEMTNIRQSIKDFDTTEKHGVSITDIIGREQETTFLTEKGLYKVLFKI
jgi:prophage antirepressor-like protein